MRRCRSLLLVAVLTSLGAAWVGPEAASARPTVLTTGDSMVQIVDVYLARKLGRRAHVRRDAHVSTGISKRGLLDWPRYARRQASRFKPRVTVMFLGANEGFPMRTPKGRKARCCGRAWVHEYGRRARTMMAAYARGGLGKVYWLLLPQARSGFFRRAYPAVNKGLRLAARSMRRDVRIVHLNRTFTPGGRYRDVIRYHGRLVHARQKDGIHLSPAGASIAAAIVARRIRVDHALRRPR